MQLVAYGAQDIYLTGNPQITFFKVVYRRHTNFSMECIRQTINGNNDFTSAGEGNVTISRNGDLVHKIYVETAATGVTNGSRIVHEAELEIGGQRIDRHFNDWNEAWNELSTPESKALGLKSMQGCIGSTNTLAPGVLSSVQIPLQFWFCRNPGLALPLIALQYHEVKVKITWEPNNSSNSSASDTTCEVWCDYIYLDTDERRRFAQVSHEYLIEQIQRQSLNITGTSAINQKLNFNHPVKELIWTYPSGKNITDLQLKLNGHDRFAKKDEAYFTLRQPYDYHSAVPRQNLPTSAQISLLDRQSTVTTPNGLSVTLTCLNTIGSGDAFDFVVATNRLALHSSGTNISSSRATDFAAGTQLLLITGDSGAGGPRIMYSSQVTSGGEPIVNDDCNDNLSGNVANNGVAMTITTPTPLTGTTAFYASSAGVPATGTDKLDVFIISNGASNQARTSQMINKIGVYSFALKPEEHQPSGTCNFSRIDNAKLEGRLNSEGAPITVYAVNYNVLRIMSGMGGLAYSN